MDQNSSHTKAMSILLKDINKSVFGKEFYAGQLVDLFLDVAY